MSGNHRRRQPVAHPDAALGTCKHCGRSCAPTRRQHDDCAEKHRAANDYRQVAAEREGRKQRCVDCRRVEGTRYKHRTKTGWEWRELVIERDHPQRLADNGPRHWTVARCGPCHETKTATENRTTQPRRRSVRRTNRRTPMKHLAPMARWIAGGALIAGAVWWARQDFDAPRRAGKDGAPALPDLPSVDVAALGRWALLALVGALVLGALYWWARTTSSRRSEKVMDLGDGIAALTNTAPDRMVVKVKRWRAGLPVAGTAAYSWHFDDKAGSQGRAAVEELLGRKIGERLDFTWTPHRDTLAWSPATGAAPEPVDAAPEPDQSARHEAMKRRVEESVRAAIKGEVDVDWGTFDAVGPLTFAVAYPSAFPDESPETRLQLAERVNNKAPGRWRASWDTEENRVRFDRRPPMPRMLPNPVSDDTDTWRLPFGVDEAGDVVAWSLRDAAHMLVVGGTGAGKTVALRSIITDACARGFTVFCVDPKRIELTGLRDWPGVRAVASSIEEMIALVSMLADEMDARYAAIEAGDITEDALPPVLIVIDEATEFINRSNAWWKANKPKGASGTEHPVVERWRSMARLGRSGRMHLVVGIQRPDAKVFGGEARDNYGFRVALGPLSEQGARMVFGRADVGRDVPQDAKGRATVGIGEDKALEAQTYYTPNPRTPENPDEKAHLAALRDHAAGRAADAVPHINARTISQYAEALADPDAPLPRQVGPSYQQGAPKALPELAAPAEAPAYDVVSLDFVAREVAANGSTRLLLDENGTDVEVTVEVAPCPSVDDEDLVELDYVRPDGHREMVLIDADEKVRRLRVPAVPGR